VLWVSMASAAQRIQIAMCPLIISIAVMMRYVLRLNSISAVRSSQKSRLERALTRSVFSQTPLAHQPRAGPRETAPPLLRSS